MFEVRNRHGNHNPLDVTKEKGLQREDTQTFPFRSLRVPHLFEKPRATSISERIMGIPANIVKSLCSIASQHDSDEGMGDEVIDVMDDLQLTIPSSVLGMEECTTIIADFVSTAQFWAEEIITDEDGNELDLHALLATHPTLKKTLKEHFAALQIKLDYYNRDKAGVDEKVAILNLLHAEKIVLDDFNKACMGIAREEKDRAPIAKFGEIAETDDIDSGYELEDVSVDVAPSVVQQSLSCLEDELKRMTLVACCAPEAFDFELIENFLLIDAQQLPEGCDLDSLYNSFIASMDEKDQLFDRLDNTATQDHKKDIINFIRVVDVELSKKKHITKQAMFLLRACN